MVAARSFRFTVLPSEAGQRLDRLVAAHAGGIGRKRARELFERGEVRVDEARGRPGELSRAGAEISFELADDGATPDPSFPLDVRLETPALLVVNKPAGVPSAPLRPGELGTVANGLVARYPELAEIGHRAREPGLLHRLDTPTSGLLIAARTAPAFARLERALRAGKLEKRYLAIVSGDSLPERGVIESPLAPDPASRGRVRVPEANERYARASSTAFRVVEQRGGYRLLELEVSRGFRHQIRAHLASRGAPLLGDERYGGPPWQAHPGRFALHASYVAWAGDATLARFSVALELPDDMRELFPDRLLSG